MITEKEVFSISDSLNASPSCKTLYKFWSGLTKLLLYTFTEKSVVSFDIFGTFSSSPPHFQPSALFSQSLPYSISSPVQALKNKISTTALSQLCKMNSETINSCKKTLLSRIKSQLSIGIILRLNLKIGYLVLQPAVFHYTPAKKNSLYHPSNPNPVNDDSSNNLTDYKQDKILYSKVSLPPIAVQSKTTPTIVSKFSRKQFIEPYIPARELLSLQKSGIKDRIVSKTPEANSLQYLDRIDEVRGKNKEMEQKEIEEINKSIIEHNSKKKMEANIEKMKEKYSYFPFTEGDSVEEHRKKINTQRKEEFLASAYRPGIANISHLSMKAKEILLNNSLLTKRSYGLY